MVKEREEEQKLDKNKEVDFVLDVAITKLSTVTGTQVKFILVSYL